MSEMEKEVKDFFKRIIQTISLGLLWLLINATAGIMYGHMFIDKKPTLGKYQYGIKFLLFLSGHSSFFYSCKYIGDALYNNGILYELSYLTTFFNIDTPFSLVIRSRYTPAPNVCIGKLMSSSLPGVLTVFVSIN